MCMSPHICHANFANLEPKTKNYENKESQKRKEREFLKGRFFRSPRLPDLHHICANASNGIGPMHKILNYLVPASFKP